MLIKAFKNFLNIITFRRLCAIKILHQFGTKKVAKKVLLESKKVVPTLIVQISDSYLHYSISK